MKIFTSTPCPLILVLALAAVASGCASSKDQESEAARGHFIADFVPELPGSCEAIVDAGYLDNQDPSSILIQRGAEVFEVPATQRLSGETIFLEPGDVIRIIP